jgi:hypothetical protein
VTEKASPHRGKISRTPHDIFIGISADLLDYTSWIQGWIQFNCRSVRKLPYSMWLPSELYMCANSEDTLGYMVSCRILRDIHVPCLQAKDHFFI